MDDDLVCEYDSTWDTESDGDELENSSRCKKTRPAFWSNSFSRNLRAAKDMQTYRHGYPNMNEDECPEERMTNLKFYLNEIKSSPDDVSIEAFHTEWRTDYKRLERVHSYIQWLFPLREPGVNYMAAELTKKEIQAFRENEEAKSRLLDSYELMLGFYGIQLVNRESGEVKRADNWRERFVNLEKNLHNNLRITRILKSLGELGFEHFQAPLVCFFLEETLVRKTLSSIKRSVLDYFLFAVRDKRERRKLVQFAFQHFEPKDKFVWCPRKIQKRFKKKSEKRQNSAVDNGESVTDEGHSQCKYRDEETINVPKFSKPADELLKANKNVDVDFVLDTEKHSEEETEDHKLHLGDCCADLPLNDRLGLDVGEMDDFNVAEENSAEGNGMDGHNELLEIQPDQEVMLCAKWEAVAGSTSECPLASPDDSEKNHQETSSGASEEDTTPEDPPTLSLELPGNASDTRSGVETLSTTQEQQENRESVNGPERGEPMDIVDSSPE